MSDERDEERQGESKIHVVDRRMLSDDERSGKGSVPAGSSAAPKLEIVGGGREAEQPVEEPGDELQPIGEPGDEEEPITAEEMQAMRDEMEAEQFAAIEQQMGRALTEDEKDKVRAQMEKEAQSMASLEVIPMLHRSMSELSARAAVHMGLMPNPYTRLIARNDVEARLAIDAFGALYEVMKPKLEPALQREYSRVLNDLRVNFVTQTGIPLDSPSGSGKGSGLIIH